MYKDLEKLYYKTNIAIFSCAVTYLIEKGMDNVKEFKDRDIAELKGNGLMTAEYVQAIVRTARDIARTIKNPNEIIQFCDAKGIFETVIYTNGEVSDRATLERAVRVMSNYILYDDTVSIADTEQLADYLDMDIEELESLFK